MFCVRQNSNLIKMCNRYPAGHTYFYTILYYLMNDGQIVRRAQYIYMLIYMILLMIVFRIYIITKTVSLLIFFQLSVFNWKVMLLEKSLNKDPVGEKLLWGRGRFIYLHVMSFYFNCM